MDIYLEGGRGCFGGMFLCVRIFVGLAWGSIRRGSIRVSLGILGLLGLFVIFFGVTRRRYGGGRYRCFVI